MSLSKQFWRHFVLLVLLAAAVIIGVAALAAAGQAAAILWFAAAAGVLAFSAACWIALQRIYAPLQELSAAAQRLRPASDDGSAVDGDELGRLGAAFSQMERDLSRRVGQVQENSERLQTVLGSMIEGVLAVSADQRILLANDAGRRMLDFTASDPVGKPLLSVTRARPVYEAVVQAATSQTPIETEFQSPGAHRRSLALRATRLPGAPSPGVMVVLHDVTELRRLENLRRELVANVSHELKTPLAAIKAYAETLRMGAVDDPEHNLIFVRRIEEQAERLHQMIVDMLHIARVEAGTETFEIVPVPLRELLDEVAAHFAEAAAARQIELAVQLPPEGLSARGDEEGIRTILSNLVDNAVKYTPSHGRVTLRVVPSEATVTLEVEDTGIGIAEQDQARVFERFYRVDKARSRELGGTGLGLSIVKHLAQAFGGSVGITSAPGKGSVFRVTLPRANL